MNMLCFRLLPYEEKATALSTAISAVQEGHTLDSVVHAVDPASFRQVPGSPFSYWVSERIRRLFAELPPFESEGRTVRVGLQTSDDFRFVRAWWEVAPERILDGANGPDWREDLMAFQAWCRQRTFEGKRWVPFAKGGAYSPYYADLNLVVNWERDGEEIQNFDRAFIRNKNFYFRPGLTWPRRTQLGLNLRVYPAGAIFADKGPVAFVSQGDLASYLALANSRAFGVVISLQMAFGSYEVGVVQRSPVPNCTGHGGKQLGDLARSAVVLKQTLDTADETSHVFALPALLQVPGYTLAEGTQHWAKRVTETAGKLTDLQQQIDAVAYQLYGIGEESQRAMNVSLEEGGTTTDGEEDEDASEVKSAAADFRSLITDLLSFALGAALGRWDVRFATGEKSLPKPSDPFAPLPVCSPGMLTGDGLPSHQAPPGYPLHIAPDSLIVDDPDHPADLVRHVRKVLEVLWQDHAEAIEQKACELLGVKELRDYFRKPGKDGFWDNHMKRYSKSRRKAPIYWLLQSSKKNYALWLYYHRLDKDTLFKALLNYVEPKIRLEENRLEPLRAQRTAAGASGKRAKQLEKDIDRQEEFISELRDFEDKLRRVANLHLEPDLNDGVVLNIAPLWELVPWKEARNYWEELLGGQYEWSSIGKQLYQRGLVRSL